MNDNNEQKKSSKGESFLKGTLKGYWLSELDFCFQNSGGRGYWSLSDGLSHLFFCP